MWELRLFPGLPGGCCARLQPITGSIEEGIDADDPAGFGRLLDRLLVAADDTTVGPGRAFDLALADHDRLASELYRRQFGPTISSTIRCRQCGRDYELSFNLAPTMRSATPMETMTGPDDQGIFSLLTGARFRLPTLRDRLATLDAPSNELRHALLRRCTEVEAMTEEAMATIENAMEIVGPLIGGRLAADCPHCRFHEDSIPFSIQQFLLDALVLERRFLPSEVHCIARTYGWSRHEIMNLPTNDRRQHVRMIMAETAPR